MVSSSPICPIHKDGNGCSVFWEFTFDEKKYQLIKCDVCDLIFYYPSPEIDYKTHTDSIDSVKDYVHLNSNIEGLINNLLSSIPNESYCSMLEIGCGFGFTLDFARRILNMEVVGYEPSLYGEVGGKELGLDIRRRYLTKEDLQERKFDIIFLSEVLEHIQDPLSFISFLKEGLTEKGVLVLTTPNYKRIKKTLHDPTDLAMLSPGAHINLFSEKSLTDLLKNAGLAYVSIDAMGNSLIAKSSFKKIDWQDHQDTHYLIRKYYTEVLENTSPQSLTYTGIFYRLLRNYVDFGNYEEANDLLIKHPFPPLPYISEVEKIKTSEDINKLTVSCGALLFYYIGIMKLNYYKDFDTAASYFLISYLLCRKKLEIVPSSAVLEFNMVWMAAYHYALSLSNSGKLMQAKSQIEHLINFKHIESNQYMPLPTLELISLSNNLMNGMKNQNR
jgi:2-polyprenyl-3-methyl-5-hydroxy-6-metoxy-1,4-benzoquinol methylase